MGIFSFWKCSEVNTQKSMPKSFHGMNNLSSTFVILNENFAIDSIHVYYKNYVIEGAEMKNFKALDDHYGKDNKTVFYCYERRESQTYLTTKKATIIRLANVDPESFHVLENGYGLDKNQGYYEGKEIKVKDIETFKNIGPSLSKDRYFVYYEDKVLNTLDGGSFEIINSFYAKDKNYYYIYSYPGSDLSQPRIVTDALSELILLEYPYSKNKQHVFYLDRVLEGLNPDQCMIINPSYVKDNQHVFLLGSLIHSADALTFNVPEQISESTNTASYSMDKLHVFYGTKMIIGADTKSFNILGNDYSKDSHTVFYKTTPIQGLDHSTFEVFNYRRDDGDAKDNKTNYLFGKRIKIN